MRRWLYCWSLHEFVPSFRQRFASTLVSLAIGTIPYRGLPEPWSRWVLRLAEFIDADSILPF